MSVQIGIVLAIIAMISWGIGDFLIQRSTRLIGNFETLFTITAFGAIFLLPFVWHDLPSLINNTQNLMAVLVFSSCVILIAALLEFEALRRGKLSVVEPIWSLEIPAAVLIAYILIGETLTSAQGILIACLIIGLVCVSFRGGKINAKHFLEKGALLSVMAALFMGVGNFFMGISGRMTNSLLANFVACVVMATVTLAYIVSKGRTRKLVMDIKSHPLLLLIMSIFDNAAWIAFVAAMSIAPIGIVVALTESYIIIVVLLGLMINKEKLTRHQKVGLVVALFAAVILASISG